MFFSGGARHFNQERIGGIDSERKKSNLSQSNCLLSSVDRPKCTIFNPSACGKPLTILSARRPSQLEVTNDLDTIILVGIYVTYETHMKQPLYLIMKVLKTIVLIWSRQIASIRENVTRSQGLEHSFSHLRGD